MTLEGLPAGPVELLLGAVEHRPIQVQVEIPKDGVGQLARTLERIPYGTLTLEVVPSDATVTLPNIAPVYRPGLRVPEGQLQVVVRRPGYREVTRTVDVVADTRERIELVPNPQSFTVVTMPAEAVISLLNSDDDYRNGIPLEPGEYRIRVSAPEYETVEETVIHGTEPTHHRVTLVRSPQTFSVATTPYTAAISFVDTAESYRPGMRLAPGEYRIRVSAPEYETVEETVIHGTEPTQYSVTLVYSPQTFSVTTTPYTAAISFVDTAESYRPGMRLAPGEYRIRVSAPEYETVEETVTHSTEPTHHRVTLVRSPQSFTVVATPTDSTVQLVGVSEVYVPGMRLAPGEYRVRVSASDYETYESTVRHGTAPTRYVIELESIPQPGETFADALMSGGKGPDMVVIPAGNFQMGCLSYGNDCNDDERPVHYVRIPEHFALSKYEVTFAQWDACVVDGGCNGYRPSDEGWGRGSRPVINVSWEVAQTYVSWLSRSTGKNYRLPSESEWEYAARAGSTTQYNWGNDIGRNQANCDGCGSLWDDNRSAPVGSFTANALGLHDMHGNVWEWVEDCWNDSYNGAPRDGAAWSSGDCALRVLRGGSWGSRPRDLRAANRGRGTTGGRNDYDGFRVARTLAP